MCEGNIIFDLSLCPLFKEYDQRKQQGLVVRYHKGECHHDNPLFISQHFNEVSFMFTPKTTHVIVITITIIGC